MKGIPRGAFVVVKEILRHVLRRPVVGIAVVARDEEGRFLLVRRADTGTWALPGGTLEWGERLRPCLVRELREETNAVPIGEPRLVGVYSEPSRDPRFHAVTVVAECRVSAPAPRPENPVEIHEARFFAEGDLPAEMAFGMHDMLDVVRQKREPHLE
ncbi:MAG TPA: NUDIX domain-containing protein [Polyangiaceae bacterium]